MTPSALICAERPGIVLRPRPPVDDVQAMPADVGLGG